MDDLVNAGEFRGHRENSATSCPGDAAMRIIVNGPPPPTARPVHYFEELPFSQGGRGPVIVGQAAGYAQRRVMVAKLAAFKAAHPRTPVSTMREGDDGSGEDDAARYFILTWAPGTHGQRYRFGPWRSEASRDAVQRKRERNTGRTLRAFRGRQRSLYPWPS